jgi:hypothetical protein
MMVKQSFGSAAAVAASVLVAYPGATITGNDIDCGQQQGSKYPGSNAAGCTVCGSNLKGIEAACRRLPSCVAFVYDDASGCADLKVRQCHDISHVTAVFHMTAVCCA